MRNFHPKDMFKGFTTKVIWCFIYLIFLKLVVQNVHGVLRKFILTRSPTSGYLLNFTESAALNGYWTEEHTVVTEDGYVLTVFRIPKGKNCHGEVRKPPVLLMHGLLLTSDSWLDAGTDAGLGYLLSDACYDLWSGNVRGSYYSRKHQTLNPDVDSKYWQFYLHHVGSRDLPAIIDYVLYKTNSQKLNYIGYSQSGASALILCSERPNHCKKLGLAILLHPSSRMKNTKSKTFRLATKLFRTIEPHLSSANSLEVFPLGGKLQTSMASLCQDIYIADVVCRPILDLIDSSHPGSVDVETIRTAAGHFPAGTSAMTMAWFNQMTESDNFYKYDYGPTKNMQIYGQTFPQSYKINNTKIPVLLIHGKNDFLVSLKDMKWLKDQLPNLLELYIVKDPLWNHFDVAYSRHVKKLLFPKINKYLSKYTDSNRL